MKINNHILSIYQKKFEDHKNHYVLIKDFNKFMFNQNSFVHTAYTVSALKIQQILQTVKCTIFN